LGSPGYFACVTTNRCTYLLFGSFPNGRETRKESFPFGSMNLSGLFSTYAYRLSVVGST
jgi:hypothetical protein